MNREYLKSIWKKEEEIAHIHGWDFSHIHGRYEEENACHGTMNRLLDSI
jgi:hypothetical protein